MVVGMILLVVYFGSGLSGAGLDWLEHELFEVDRHSMATETQAFPDRFQAAVVSADTTLNDAISVMPYDVAAVAATGTAGDPSPQILGTITRTQIKHALRIASHTEDTAVEDLMEPYEALDEVDTLEQRLQDIFYVLIYMLVKRQVETKVFSPVNQDSCLGIVFEHLRNRVRDGKYEDCIHRMTFSHWVRTVANNKIIDELRKLPSAESVDAYRDSVGKKSKCSATNPVLAVNQSDVFKIIQEAMKQLPEKQRIALTYSIQNPDAAGQEVAAALGMTVNAYHLNLNRARDKMQKILTELAPETVNTVKQLRNRPRKD